MGGTPFKGVDKAQWLACSEVADMFCKGVKRGAPDAAQASGNLAIAQS
jgi:hypothetical protein